MGRPRATAAAGTAASRPRRANAKSKPAFLSPPAPATRKRNARARAPSSSPSSPSPSPSSPTDVSFVAPPSSVSPEPAPKSRSCKPSSKAKAKPAARSPPLASPRPVSPLSAGAPPAAAALVSSVGDLRSAAASQMESLRHRLDGLHSRVHTDLDASLSRASKRFKTQNQACQQLTDEVDNEYRKISDNLKENAEKLKAKYKQIMAETQSSTSRACKVTIPEITKSVEKAIDGLRRRYNISMPV